VTSSSNPLAPFLQRNGVVLLDGGLATALEAAGHVLRDDLWSARLLIEDPDAIRSVHEAYLNAGADCILTASYQATLEGFLRRGLSQVKAEELLLLSVQLAMDARTAVLNGPHRTAVEQGTQSRPIPLVAASIGPYGASLADGSEYHGAYGISDAALADFHQRRWEILTRSQADLLACETIPSHQELRVLLELVRLTPGSWAWVSVTCRDGERLRDGSPLREVLAQVDHIHNLAAVGVNCTAPRHIASCIREIRHVTRKPIVVYPNSGAHYDEKRRTWVEGPVDGHEEAIDWQQAAVQWRVLGAQGIGGCCRVGPAAIASMRTALMGSPA